MENNNFISSSHEGKISMWTISERSPATVTGGGSKGGSGGSAVLYAPSQGQGHMDPRGERGLTQSSLVPGQKA